MHELGTQNLVKKRGQLFLVEGREPAEQDVEDDASRPHVDRASLIALIAKHLGRNVAWCAAGCAHQVLIGDDTREPEVCNLEWSIGRLVGQQYVFRLEVTMNDVVGVHVVERIAERGDDIGRVALCVLTALDDAVEELSARHQLHDQVHLSRGSGARVTRCV